MPLVFDSRVCVGGAIEVKMVVEELGSLFVWLNYWVVLSFRNANSRHRLGFAHDVMGCTELPAIAGSGRWYRVVLSSGRPGACGGASPFLPAVWCD